MSDMLSQADIDKLIGTSGPVAKSHHLDDITIGEYHDSMAAKYGDKYYDLTEKLYRDMGTSQTKVIESIRRGESKVGHSGTYINELLGIKPPEAPPVKAAEPIIEIKPTPKVDTGKDLLDFKEKNGYPKGFDSKEKYEEWLEAKKPKSKPKVEPPIEVKASPDIPKVNEPIKAVPPTPKIEVPPKVTTTPIGNKPPRAAVDLNAAGLTDDAKKMADKAMKNTDHWLGKAGMIVGGIALAATIVDMGLKHQDKMRMHAQTNEQERYAKKREKGYNSFSKDTYYNLEQLNGLPQQLYNDRNGHSNSWGGKKY